MNILSNTSIVENIWNDFNKPLKNYIKKHINNEQDADDVLQNVFFKIQTNIANLKNVEKIHVWIYIITNNAITDFYRTQKHEITLELTEEIACYSQEEVNANHEVAQCLKTMVNSLPEKYKTAIILTEFQNLTQKELSLKIGLSVSGAKSRVQRARNKLKEMLLNCCSLELDYQGNVVDYKNKCDECKFC
ncbi:MAG: RNA polymerase sigma factor SigZ [Eubacteriales bacterium]